MSSTVDPTAEKALAINLDPSLYGTFAEIGAGQEVARWFFSVGGAAGTVAKTISAYDMTVSDFIYGKAPRYVSRERIDEMLDHDCCTNVLMKLAVRTRGSLRWPTRHPPYRMLDATSAMPGWASAFSTCRDQHTAM